MTTDHFASLCRLLATKERMHSFVASLDEIIAAQSQNTDFFLKDELFTREEFSIMKEIVKSYDELKNIRKKIFDVPVFSMQISFIPNKQFLSKIISTLQSNIFDPFFLDIVVNPGIIGGCVIEFKGMYSDKSLKRDLNKWMKARTLNHG